MKKYYQIIIVFIGLLMANLSYSQTSQTKVLKNEIIQGLTVYPNPVSDGILYIISSKNLPKEVVVFDVLGKKVLYASLLSNTLNISTLTAGVYIIKIAEGNSVETRKFVIR